MTDRIKNRNPRWYDGVTRYQWLVLAIASLGWIFDVFEGQIFVASMNEAMPSLLPESVKRLAAAEREGYEAFYNNVTLCAFLLGGALGGIIFGIASDRFGRKRAMTYTILMYSAFTFISAFAQIWWHMAACRFLVAMGVGGEWAVASAMVAEVFPQRARAWSLGIFHASSVLGTYLAVAAGVWIIGNPALQSQEYPSLAWRIGFAIGVLPALLIIWVRLSLREPERWQKARTTAREDFGQRLGSFSQLFTGSLRRHTLVGVGLAAVGLATFWGVHIYGKNLLRRQAIENYLRRAPALVSIQNGDGGDGANANLLANDDTFVGRVAEIREAARDARARERIGAWVAQLEDRLPTVSFAAARQRLLNDTPPDEHAALEPVLQSAQEAVLAPHTTSIKRWEMFGMFLVTTGGGLGLLAFGPICERIGRRGAFFGYQLGGLAAGLIVFQWLSGTTVLVIALPIFGFLTLGMHAGYAIYFPELYPTRLRGTGGGFCFNVGRILAAPVLLISGWMQRDLGYSLENAASILSLLFLVGIVLLIVAPETKGKPLPE